MSLAQAFLHRARTALDARSPAVARRTRAALTAQVDPLSGWGGLRDGDLLLPSSLTAVVPTLPGRGGPLGLVPLTRQDLTVHDAGRDQRLPSLALRELLSTLDGQCCRVPVCSRRRKLHAHHVVPWDQGGRTDLDDLTHREYALRPP